MSTIRFSTYPRTEPPPEFATPLAAVFQYHETEILFVLLYAVLYLSFMKSDLRVER